MEWREASLLLPHSSLLSSKIQGVLVVALEKVERSSGSLVGSSMTSIKKSAAPEMLLALMDEAYTGSPIGDGGTSLDLSCNGCCFAGCNNSPHSDRLEEALKIAPRLLDSYLASAVHDANDCSAEACRIHACCLSPFSSFLALSKKSVVNRLGEAYDNPAKTELALQLCWAIGEHGGGGGGDLKDAARELFESLELLLYENLSSSRLGLCEASHSFRVKAPLFCGDRNSETCDLSS